MLLALEVLFGWMEAFCLFALGFTMYRIPIRSYIGMSLSLSFLVSIMNTWLIEGYEIPYQYIDVINLFITIGAFYVWGRFKIWYSILLCLSGKIISSALQMIIFLILSNARGYTIGAIATSDDLVNLFILQAVQFFVSISIAWFSYSRGWGIHFIAENTEIREGMKGLNLAVISTVLLGVIFFLFSTYIWSKGFDPALYLLNVFYFVFVMAMWIIYHKAKVDMQKHYNERRFNFNN